MNIAPHVNAVYTVRGIRESEVGMAARPARPRRRSSYHHGDLREALVAAAVELIGQFGPRGFSMSQACRAAAVSPSALYRHFASKEALLAEVARRGFVGLAAACDPRTAAPLPSAAAAAGRLVELGRAYVRYAVEHPAVFRAMFGSGIDKAAFPDLAAAGDAAAAGLAAEVARARAAGGIRRGDPAGAAAALWSVAHGVAMLRVDDPDGHHGPGDVDAVLRTVVAGLRAEPAAVAKPRRPRAG